MLRLTGKQVCYKASESHFHRHYAFCMTIAMMLNINIIYNITVYVCLRILVKENQMINFNIYVYIYSLNATEFCKPVWYKIIFSPFFLFLFCFVLLLMLLEDVIELLYHNSKSLQQSYCY